jgi:hypothetical protein
MEVLPIQVVHPSPETLPLRKSLRPKTDVLPRLRLEQRRPRWHHPRLRPTASRLHHCHGTSSANTCRPKTKAAGCRWRSTHWRCRWVSVSLSTQTQASLDSGLPLPTVRSEPQNTQLLPRWQVRFGSWGGVAVPEPLNLPRDGEPLIHFVP